MNLEKGIVPVWIKLLIQRIKLFNSKLLEDLQVLLIRVRSRGTIIFALMADGAKLTERDRQRRRSDMHACEIPGKVYHVQK